MKDYKQYDAVALAELVKKGETTPAELIDAAIDQAESINPKINAIVTPTYGAARENAEGLNQGPLRGIPFLVKDLNHVAGVPTSMGSRLFQDYVPDHDGHVVTRFRNAGLNIMGKTNTPEIGLAATTESVALGVCRNPWNTDHTPGGSSGGAAAAVAAGIVPVAHATDGGGSIRIPASCCGLVGLKPSRGRTPLGPDVGEGWGGMSTGHVVSRTVRDSAAILDVIQGPMPGDPYHGPTDSDSFLSRVNDHPGSLRVAIDCRAFTGHDTHTECLDAVQKVASTLARMGHLIDEQALPLDHEEWGFVVSSVVLANVAHTILTRCASLGVEPTLDVVERNTLRSVEIGRQLSATNYVKAIQRMHQLSREMAAFMQDWDVILSPTLVSPPVKTGWLDPNDDPDVYGSRFGGYWGFTNLYNATGQPAISLPLHRTAEGLPVGVQFAARYGDEATLLQLAAQLEAEVPWPLTAEVE
ncbi:MAG: amidase [Chloroflexi bacterium]|jgi:Asp-tRNA(Asn)/Glu-tRNA(Gln) amidotransferase A subunit family amidase|nr:amidase [Chloroflexota bacterium]